ncbi:hypothetical protein [Erythrobacter rubeus]|uniref:DUF2927 domain-containing protein n=1 Tax=Erythrobacter rubeus TaxID=2760803 RepID=A0ABR8KQM2_9SPHN|nr:hypothetical protein [Erythrobacter rubeus]MBD2841353.1 hypothetical protein [Erythrobacter rubeus]
MPVSALFLASLALAAQPESSPAPVEDDNPVPEAQRSESDGRIVVEAPPTARERRRELRRMARDVIRRPRAGRTVGSYFRAICPKVFGIPDRPAKAIEDRMKSNAEELGVNRRDQSSNCRHNVSVIFVPPEKGPAEAWLTYESDLLKHLLSFQRLRVINEKDPVRAWGHDVVRTSDGGQSQDFVGRSISQAADFGNRAFFASRLLSATMVEIVGSVVMIELESAQGKTLHQLADYASMRSFANTAAIDPDTQPSAPTILTLFQDEDPPEELTAFDRAFISMLYDTSRNALKSRFYGNIATRALRMEQEDQAASGGD